MTQLLTRPRRRAVIAGLIVSAVLIFITKAAADQCDLHWLSGAYKGTVSDCTTSATVGLDKAGFNNIGSKPRTAYTSIWGYHGSYYALVLCTKNTDKVVFTQMVIGPTGKELETLYNALDKDFK